MIKKVTKVQRVPAEEHALVCELLQRVGFAQGPSWTRGASQGNAFEAPVAQIEIAHGADVPNVPELMVEVSELESVEKITKALADTRIFVGEVEETDWKSQLLRVRIGTTELGFWMHTDPEKNIVPAIEGDLDATGMRFGIVVSRWNQVITERVLHGSLDALRRSGAQRDDITIVRVPGAYELPMGARALAETGKVDAVITLGCLIRGETTHYEHIADEATRGIGQSAQETGVPHAYGLLTCETLEQALDRAGLKAGNKGFEAAMSAIEMVSVKRKLGRA
jgi:6,7-dimethyl-8-ribityllumazine synthase